MAKTKKAKAIKTKLAKPLKKKTIPREKPKSVAQSGKIDKKPVKKKSQKKKKDPLMCFLTTACVKYYSLPDDAYELTTLRKYRDNYLASSVDGKRLINDYYRISPKLVELANGDSERKTVYEFIYSRIRKACSEIEKQKYSSAKKIYVNLVGSLMKKYHVN
jgi:hypothetical protein